MSHANETKSFDPGTPVYTLVTILVSRYNHNYDYCVLMLKTTCTERLRYKLRVALRVLESVKHS